MVGASFLVIQLMMVSLWCVYYVRGNSTIVDVGWAFGFLLSMLIYFVLGEGPLLKTLVLLAMVAIWSIRLGWHLYQRYETGIEDPRYVLLREKMGEERSEIKFLALFIFQGVLVQFLSLPFLLVSCCSADVWSFWEVLGLLVWAVGVVGEYFADEQLRAFKASKERGDGVCREGWWRYSRHPNYFFEWVVWMGFFFYALSASMGWLAVLSPLLIYYLLRYVSGVPLLEDQLVKTKGEAYRLYQGTTSEFFPWPPQRSKSP